MKGESEEVVEIVLSGAGPSGEVVCEARSVVSSWDLGGVPGGVYCTGLT